MEHIRFSVRFQHIHGMAFDHRFLHAGKILPLRHTAVQLLGENRPVQNGHQRFNLPRQVLRVLLGIGGKQLKNTIAVPGRRQFHQLFHVRVVGGFLPIGEKNTGPLLPAADCPVVKRAIAAQQPQVRGKDSETVKSHIAWNKIVVYHIDGGAFIRPVPGLQFDGPVAGAPDLSIADISVGQIAAQSVLPGKHLRLEKVLQLLQTFLKIPLLIFGRRGKHLIQLLQIPIPQAAHELVSGILGGIQGFVLPLDQPFRALFTGKQAASGQEQQKQQGQGRSRQPDRGASGLCRLMHGWNVLPPPSGNPWEFAGRVPISIPGKVPVVNGPVL